MAKVARIAYRNPYYDGQLVRTLAAARVGSADLGEAMATARRVGRLDGDRWHRAWSETAAAAVRAGEQARGRGQRLSACRAFLRASEYYRQAYYFIRSDLADSRLRADYRGHVESFGAAAQLMQRPAEQVSIPYQGATLKGYWFVAGGSDQARPTVLLPCGYDSTAEAGWVDVPDALERGYNALCFEGPGQGQALLEQGLHLRPDFEAVLTPVVDWVLGRPEADPARLVLVGRSFAGYLAPRAAASEHRLAALVCDPAQPDMAAHLPSGPAARLLLPLASAQARVSAGRAEFFGSRMAAHGVSSVPAYVDELRRFNMLDRAAEIRCPTLAVECEGDFAGGGGKALCRAIGARASLIQLSAAQGAAGHCAGLGQEVWAEAVYGWLDGVLS